MRDRARNGIEAKHYLAGCLKGDAWLGATHRYLCLRCIDVEFATEFARCIRLAYNTNSDWYVDERSYYLVRRHNKGKQFSELLDLEQVTDQEKAMWLRGVFDSEGNVVAAMRPNTNHWMRRIAMFSTNTDTIEKVSSYLSDLGIESRHQKWSMSRGHKGTKQVYAVVIRNGQANYWKFLMRVGFTIFRHQAGVHILWGSYLGFNRYSANKAAQLKGAEAKRIKYHEQEFPRILAELKEYLKRGGKPSQRACCAAIKGYGRTMGNYFTHSQMLEKAR